MPNYGSVYLWSVISGLLDMGVCVVDKPWKSKKFQQRARSSYQCRCNVRECQARITTKHHPNDYAVGSKHSKCPMPRCKGHLYVDWYRMWKGNRDKDRGAVCHCDKMPHPHAEHNEMYGERE